MEKASATKENLINCLTQELMTTLHKSCMLTPRSMSVRKDLMERLQLGSWELKEIVDIANNKNVIPYGEAKKLVDKYPTLLKGDAADKEMEFDLFSESHQRKELKRI